MRPVLSPDQTPAGERDNVIPFPKSRAIRDDVQFLMCKRKLTNALFELYDYMDATAMREVLACFDEVFKTVEELEADGQYFSGSELQSHWDRYSQDTGTNGG